MRCTMQHAMGSGAQSNFLHENGPEGFRNDTILACLTHEQIGMPSWLHQNGYTIRSGDMLVTEDGNRLTISNWLSSGANKGIIEIL